MKIETGHKTFDKQSHGYIMTGNVIADTQQSLYVRPFDKTECNGHTFSPGHLQEVDLNNLGNEFSNDVKFFIKKLSKTEKIIAYQFRHFNKDKKMVHGYVVTNDKHECLRSWTTPHTYKSHNIMSAAIKAVTKERIL